MITDRRSCLRHKVHGPIFASFDGVTGGMILDLSEQGLSMQTVVPLEAGRQFQISLDLPDSDTRLETTGYIAWADALGRAGVRFSELPVEARQRLDEWLALNDTAPVARHRSLPSTECLGRAWAASLQAMELASRDPLVWRRKLAQQGSMVDHRFRPQFSTSSTRLGRI